MSTPLPTQGLTAVPQLLLLAILPTAIGTVSGKVGGDAASLRFAPILICLPAWLFGLACFLSLRVRYAHTAEAWRYELADGGQQSRETVVRGAV